MLSGPSSRLALGGEEIHVWSAGLLLTPEELARCQAVLSEDEQARAAHFYFERDRSRYIAGRGQLRMLLGRYLGLEPASVALVYGPQGKPSLAVPPPNFPLSFNLTHSEDVVIYAFCLNRRIGVDVERVRSMQDAGAFASQFFSPSEREVLASLHGDKKAGAFFAIWTGKEALLKAIGSGLTRPMNQTVVSLDREGSVEVHSVDGVQAEAANWRLHSFEPAPGFRAALAVDGRDWILIYHPLREGLE